MGSHWKNYNANPRRRRTGDCTIRAICTALGVDWYTTYFDVVVEGAVEADMPSTNRVWRKFLRRLGFKMCLVDDHGQDYCSVDDFCEDHPHGTYILALDGHVVAAINGEYYDTWPSGEEEVLYYWIIKDGDETNK